jgi:uncharacterized beta-barrel protein YwiB (DUF1934 family)
MPESQRVVVEITSQIRMDGNETTECYEVHGDWIQRGEAHYLRYEEPVEKLGQTRTMLTVKEQEIRLSRYGDIETHMIFLPGQRLDASYQTPYGTMMLEVDTGEIEILHDRQRVRLRWSYGLSMNGEPSGNYVMEYRIREEL